MNSVDSGTLITSADMSREPDAGFDRRPAQLAADTVELARSAAVLDAGSPALVGAQLSADLEDDVAVAVRFAMTDAAYAGWAWCVTVAVVDPEQPTISEVVLLPGPDALLPPRWLPWNERIRPGDLGPGDLLPVPADDPRVVPAYVQSDDPAVDEVAHELGIGRSRVMSRPGRLDTAERWFEGDFGPTSDMAKAAPGTCVMCAFFLPLAGSLAVRFGVCGNGMSPADGHVVDVEYGCGAHSEVVVEPVPTGFRESHIDDTVLDVHPRPWVPGPVEFVPDQPEDLEYQPVHPQATVVESASEQELPPAAAAGESAASEEWPVDGPDQESAPEPDQESAPEADQDSAPELDSAPDNDSAPEPDREPPGVGTPVDVDA